MSSIEESKALVKKIQTYVYRMLCDIDELCSENGITYYLSGGTCLGAVRHKGFIPWDDDGDVMMPREDYDKFVRLFHKRFAGKYGIGELAIDREWRRQYARVWDLNTLIISKNVSDVDIGVFIDVFPIDGLPENKYLRTLYYRKVKILDALKNASYKTKSLDDEPYQLVKKLAAVVAKPFGPRFFAVRMDRAARRYSFRNSKYVAVSMVTHYGQRETIPHKYMAKPVKLDFEDRKLPVPIGYKQYLKNLYGDYMKVPEDADKNYPHLDTYELRILNEE